MRLFVDANILVATLNKEYPLFSWSSRLLSLHGKENMQIFTSPLCLAIAFYFSSKKSGEKMAREKIGMLLEHIGITSNEIRRARIPTILGINAAPRAAAAICIPIVLAEK